MREKEPGDGGKSNVQSVASAARLLLPTSTVPFVPVKPIRAFRFTARGNRNNFKVQSNFPYNFFG